MAGFVAPNFSVARGTGTRFPTAPTTPAPTSPFSTTKGGVKLGPDQSLHFTPGRGYYAGPKRAPAAPQQDPYAPPSWLVAGEQPLSNAQIAAQAGQTAGQEVQAQEAPVFQAGQATQQGLLVDEAQTAQFNKAGDQILASIPNQIQGAYDTAGREVGSLAQGFTGRTDKELANQENSGAQFAASQGVTAPVGVNPGKVGNAEYDLNGFIPGKSLAQQGAAQAANARGMEAVNNDVGRAQIEGLQGTAQTDQAKTSQDIANLAAQYPKLFTAEEHALIAENTARLSAGSSTYGHAITAQAAENTAAYHASEANTAAERAGTAARVAASNAAYHQALIQISNGKLAVSRYTAQVDAAIKQQANALKEQGIIQKGGEVNATASKDAGQIVLNGTNGPVYTGVPVNPAIYSSATSKFATPAQRVAAATKLITTLVGKPVLASTTQGSGGKYILSSGLKPNAKLDGVKSIGGALGGYATTNDPARAQRGGQYTFAQMLQAVVDQVPGIKRAAARKLLIDAGATPDGKRSGGSTSTTPPFTTAPLG